MTFLPEHLSLLGYLIISRCFKAEQQRDSGMGQGFSPEVVSLPQSLGRL